MQIRSVVVVAALGLTSLAHGQSVAVQWRVEDGGNGHWYRVVTGSVGITWPSARELSTGLGGYLATLGEPGELGFVQTLLTGAICGGPTLQAGPYLGGFQDRDAKDYSEPNGGWRWVDGSPFPGEISFAPDNFGGQQDYLYFIGAYGCVGPFGLDDIELQSSHRSFIAEWSADCNGDGIVDYGQILDGTFTDVNSNGVPDCCDAGESCTTCPGDVNDSGIVNATDIAIILGAWGTSGGKFPRSDTDGNGIVDAADLAVVLGGWGNCP